MLLNHSHAVLPPLTWPEPNRTTACASDRRCDGASADLRAYMRSFAVPMVPIAVLALAGVLAACFTPLG
jgi:hypothetical protein